MKDWIKATNCALGLRLVVEEDPEQSPASASASPPRKIRRPRAAAEIPQAMVTSSSDIGGLQTVLALI